MQPINSSTPISAHDHHERRRTLVAVVIILAGVAIGALVYQALMTGTPLFSSDKKMRAAYQDQATRQSAAFFQTHAPGGNVSDADKKTLTEFFKANASSSNTPHDASTDWATLNASAEQAYQDWKSSR